MPFDISVEDSGGDSSYVCVPEIKSVVPQTFNDVPSPGGAQGQPGCSLSWWGAGLMAGVGAGWDLRSPPT